MKNNVISFDEKKKKTQPAPEKIKEYQVLDFFLHKIIDGEITRENFTVIPSIIRTRYRPLLESALITHNENKESEIK